MNEVMAAERAVTRYTSVNYEHRNSDRNIILDLKKKKKPFSQREGG